MARFERMRSTPELQSDSGTRPIGTSYSDLLPTLPNLRLSDLTYFSEN